MRVGPRAGKYKTMLPDHSCEVFVHDSSSGGFKNWVAEEHYRSQGYLPPFEHLEYRELDGSIGKGRQRRRSATGEMEALVRLAGPEAREEWINEASYRDGNCTPDFNSLELSGDEAND